MTVFTASVPSRESLSGDNDQIVIGIQEVPASQAMEMGQIMPDVAEDSG